MAKSNQISFPMFCSEMLILKKMQIYVTKLCVPLKARSYLHDEPDMGVEGAGVGVHLHNSSYSKGNNWCASLLPECR